jgi:7-cyano-7-deazaguanine synthase
VVKIGFPQRGSSLLDKRLKVVSNVGKGIKIPPTYVPGRNIVFLSYALSFAEIHKAQAIFIGAHAQDYSGYPDCRPAFLRAFRNMARLGTKAGIENKSVRILAPLLHKNKAQIIRLGKKLGVPFELTWSCYRGGRLPCTVCDSCYYRAKGFRGAGIRDPLFGSR